MLSKTQEELVALLITSQEEAKKQKAQFKEEQNKFKEIISKGVCGESCKDNENHIGDCLICGRSWAEHTNPPKPFCNNTAFKSSLFAPPPIPNRWTQLL